MLLGLRASGEPSDRFDCWTELALLHGKEETRRNFKGYAVDISGTCGFPDLPYAPNITLGYAVGSGNRNPNDRQEPRIPTDRPAIEEARLGGIPS